MESVVTRVDCKHETRLLIFYFRELVILDNPVLLKKTQSYHSSCLLVSHSLLFLFFVFLGQVCMNCPWFDLVLEDVVVLSWSGGFTTESKQGKNLRDKSCEEQILPGTSRSCSD